MKKNLVGINLTRWVGGVSAAAHDPHLVIGVAERCEGKGASFASSPRYTVNSGNRVTDWVIHKRIIAIMDGGAIPGTASACIDKIENGGRRYVAERNRQMRGLLYPGVRSRSKLPNRVDHLRVDSESPKDV